MRSIQTGGERQKKKYNGLDQITAVPEYISGSLNYDANTYLASYTFNNNVSLNRNYDDKRRLTNLSYTNPTEPESLDQYSLSYDISDNIIQKNGDYFSYDGKNRMISGSLAGKSAGMDKEYEGESSEMQLQPDVLGNGELLTLSDSDMSLDWGARSIGIDLHYGYRVSQITLKPTTVNARILMKTSLKSTPASTT